MPMKTMTDLAAWVTFAVAVIAVYGFLTLVLWT